jgi:hypothetical protein
MLLRILYPRLWWVLVIPLSFYLTRMATVRTRAGGLREIPLEQYQPNTRRYEIVEYRIWGYYFNPNKYQVWHFIANACLVIGCVAVGKDLFWHQAPSRKPE